MRSYTDSYALARQWMTPTERGPLAASCAIPSTDLFVILTTPLHAGEIDIMEARGNGPLYPKQSVRSISSF